MLKLYSQHKKVRKYKIKLRAFSLNFQDQLKLHKEMDNLIEKLPKGSRLEISITMSTNFEFEILIGGHCFGCSLKGTANTFEDVLTKAFSFTEQELDDWGKGLDQDRGFFPYYEEHFPYDTELIA